MNFYPIALATIVVSVTTSVFSQPAKAEEQQQTDLLVVPNIGRMQPEAVSKYIHDVSQASDKVWGGLPKYVRCGHLENTLRASSDRGEEVSKKISLLKTNLAADPEITEDQRTLVEALASSLVTPSRKLVASARQKAAALRPPIQNYAKGLVEYRISELYLALAAENTREGMKIERCPTD